MKKLKKTVASVAALAASTSAVAGVVMTKAADPQLTPYGANNYVQDSSHNYELTLDIHSWTDHNNKLTSLTVDGTRTLKVGETGTSTDTPTFSSLTPKVSRTVKATMTKIIGSSGQGPAWGEIPIENIRWLSTDTTVATVDSSGVVTVVGPGISYIYAIASAEGVELNLACEITVSGDPYQIRWTSDNPDVVSVDADTGVTTAKAPGTANITGTNKYDSSIKQSYPVTVEEADVPVSGISLNTNTVTMTSEVDSVTANGTTSLKIGDNGESSGEVKFVYGQTNTLRATVSPDNATNKAVTWASSDNGVVTVDTDGNITSVKPGTATVTATSVADGTKSASATIEVKDPSSDIKWSSSSTDIVEVDESTGKTTAKAAGTATITATSVANNKKSASYDVTVSEAPVQTYTITFNANGHGTAPDSQIIESESKATNPGNLTAEGWVFGGWYTDQDCEHAVDWNASITDNATYYAKWTEATPADILPKSISLDSDNYTVEAGQTKQATATFDPTDTTNKNVTWSIVSGEEYASVDTNGLITGLKKGEATIKVTAEAKDADGKEVSATAKVTVTDGSGTDINKATVTFVSEHGTVPAPITVEKGQTVSNPGDLTAEGFTFQGWYSDQNRTINVDWSAPINSDTTYYAKWDKEAPTKATIIFDANGGQIDGNSTKSVDILVTDGTISLAGNIPTATRENYTFTGWNSSMDGTGTNITESSVISVAAGESYTVYGQWTANEKEPTNVLLDNVTIHVGDTITMEAEILPADATSKTGKSWKTGDSSIATIDQNGKLRGISVGDTTATVTLENGVNTTATVHVIAAEPTDFGIDFGTSGGKVKVGESIQLGTKNWSPDGLPETSKSVTWEVANDTGSATIDQTGKLTGVSEGSVTVTARSTVKPGLTRSAIVYVIDDSTPLIEPTGTDIVDGNTGVSVNDVELKVGESKTLTATITPANANTKTGKTWSIADPSIATIGQDGTVTGVKAGTTTVTVTLENGVSDTATVRVTNVEPTNFDIDFGASGGRVKVGESIQLGTKNWSPDGLPETSKSVTWAVANGTGAATIDQTGRLTGVSAGTVTVTATSTVNNNLSKAVSVTVYEDAIEPTGTDIVDFITGVSLDNIKLQEGETKPLAAVITPANANAKTGKTWSIADSSVATVDQNGNVTGIKAGTTIVTVTLENGVKDTATVEVTPRTSSDIEPTDVDIVDTNTGVSVNDIELKIGQSKALNAIVTPINANTKTGKTWSIADPSVATVDQNGTVTGIKEGTTTVTVTLENGVKDTAIVRVKSDSIEPTGADIVDPATGVSLNSIKVQEGETKPLTAVITPANANTKTGKTWSVGDQSIASVDNNGNVTGVKAGITTVTVTLENGVKDTATVEVTPRPSTDIVPTGVSLGTKDVYVYVGDTRTLTATITPANANVYTQKSWYINDSSVATIDQNGTVTGVKAGNTTVTVKLANGVSDTATVHVLDKSTPSYNVNFYGNGGTLSGNTTVKATAEGGYTLYSNSFPTATRSGYKFSGWNTSSNGTGTWVSAPYTFKADTALYAQWTLDTVAPTSVDISVPVTTVNPNGTVNTTYVSADNMSLKVGETKLIKATVLPYNATNKSVTYSIADPSIAKIDQNGNITGLRAGVTTATVKTVNGLTDTITVTVTPNSSVPNLYIENIKSEYPAGKKIPVTLNILDADRGERLYVYYQVDSNTPVLADTITSTGYWQNLEVEIPSNLSIGKHSFSFFVRDAAGNRSDDRGSAYVRGLNGYNGYYDPYYGYDYYGYGYDPYYGYDYYGYDYPYYWNGNYYGFDPYYYNGDAFITDVSKYNPNRNDPRTWGTRFKADITNSDPTLTLAARLQDKVKIGDDLPANLTVKDDNVGQRVTVYYQIDNGNPVDAGSFVSDGNAKNISVNIPTSGISAGEHVVTFYAVDEAGARSNANGNVTAWTAMGTNAGANQQTVTFTNGDGSGYKDSGNNAPIVDIFKANGYKTTEDVAVTISVLEKDAGQKVTTYYRLDGGAETVIKSFKSTGRANTQNLNLGRLSEGTHTLEVWAIDEDGLRSDATDGLYTFSVSRAENGTVVVTPQQPVYNTTTIKTGVEAKGSKAGIAAAVVGAVAAASAVVLKKKRK